MNRLQVAVGKTLKVKDDNGVEQSIKVETIVHSYVRADHAVINETYFINVFDLFDQLYGDDPDEDGAEWDRLKEDFKTLSEKGKKFVLGVGKQNEDDEF